MKKIAAIMTLRLFVGVLGNVNHSVSADEISENHISALNNFIYENQ